MKRPGRSTSSFGRSQRNQWMLNGSSSNMTATTISHFVAGYWQQYDERDHAMLTAAYQTYQGGGNSTYMTGKRNPGRSDKIVDQHETDFLTLTSVNIDPKHHSPKRAVRVVMITQCEKQDVLGSLPIDDNNQEIVWQYEDFKGWKNFCTNHIGELNQAVLAEKKKSTSRLGTMTPISSSLATQRSMSTSNT